MMKKGSDLKEIREKSELVYTTQIEIQSTQTAQITEKKQLVRFT